MRYASFGEFYPYYLSEHRRSGTRRLHFAGTLLVLLTLGGVAATQRWVFLWLLPLFGSGLAGPEFLRAVHARHARQCRPVCRSRRPDVPRRQALALAPRAPGGRRRRHLVRGVEHLKRPGLTLACC